MLTVRLWIAGSMISCLLALSSSAAEGTGINWQTDLEQARQAAKESGKLVLLHFWTETCGPCKRLDKTVFNQPNVAAAVEQCYVPVKINANTSSKLAKSLRITRVPTDVVMTPDGKVINMLVSPGTPMDYISKMTAVASAEASKSGAAFSLAAASSPYGPVVNQAYANLNLPEAPSADAPAAKPDPSAASAAAPQATGRYQQQAPPSVQTNPYAGIPAPAAPVPTANKPAPTQPMAATTPAPTTPPAAGPQLPPGAPPLGFEGYCPVTMKKQWGWKQGDPRFGIIHRGRTYLFAGAEQRDTFFKNPDAYAPVLSGVDPVVALEQGRAVRGLREYALEYEGRFYLFSSEKTLNRFWENSGRYATGVRQAMSTGTTPNLVR